MKLQIDTENKTIKVEQNVLFSDLLKVLNKLLPKEWKNYTLETNSTWYWYNPIPYYPSRPWTIGEPFYTTCDSGNTTTSVYNVEVVDNKTETIINDHIDTYSEVWKALAQ